MNPTIVILCGGNGSRLFPMSTPKMPKQFIALENKYSLIQNTILRLSKYKNIVLISNKDHANILEEQLNQINNEFKEEKDKIRFTIILEPFARNTCPAISIVSQIFKDQELIVIPSDHVYQEHKINEAITRATILLKNNKDKITVFGIKPTYPETGFGYLEFQDTKEEEVKDAKDSKNYKLVTKFIEKPNLEKAREYLEKKNYYWNSGMFGFNASFMNSLMQKHQEDTYNKSIKLEHSMDVIFSNQFLKYFILPDDYNTLNSISIDYAIMEKLDKSQMMLIDYAGYWNDIGSWSSVHQIKELDQNNINKDANYKSYESNNCLVIANKKVYLNGVDDLVIVETKDCILVSRKSKSQDIKKLIS